MPSKIFLIKNIFSKKTPQRVVAFLFLFVFGILATRSVVFAAYNRYAPGDTVTIGEFVYDDNFNPSTDACSTTVYYPNHTTAVVETLMTAQTDGWHELAGFIVDSAHQGLWSATMYCSSTSGGLAKMDKSFVVGYTTASSTLVADQVWNNSSRTLTGSALASGGNLATDNSVSSASSSLFSMLPLAIWNIATTTAFNVGSFGQHLAANLSASISNVASSVWTAAGRYLSGKTLSDGGNLATEGYVDTATSTLYNEIATASSSLGASIDTRASLSNQQAGWTVTMSDIDRIQAEENYRAKIYVTNYESVPTNSSVAPSLQLYNKNGVAVGGAVAMNNPSVGVYSYDFTTVGLAEDLWEVEAQTQVEAGKIITTNDYFQIVGSAPEVSVVSMLDNTIKDITARLRIKNEGSADYEYHYEWCVVNNVNDTCRDNDVVAYGSSSRIIAHGVIYEENRTMEVKVAGNYYFKVMVYYGTEKSGASLLFSAVSDAEIPPAKLPSGGGGGGLPPAPVVPVVTQTCDGADFNHDKKVNSIDFSILLAFWKTASPFRNPCIDVNKDQKVNSVDFSILMYEWGSKK